MEESLAGDGGSLAGAQVAAAVEGEVSRIGVWPIQIWPERPEPVGCGGGPRVAGGGGPVGQRPLLLAGPVLAL